MLTLALQPVHGQPAFETQRSFAIGLAGFMDALTGTYGDEGSRLTAGIEAMQEGLDRWNASLDAATVRHVSDNQGTPSADACVRLGALYLEWGRIPDALRELEDASRLDPGRADVELLRGLAHERAGRVQEAVAAFRLARQRDPTDPVKAYMLVQHTPGVADSHDAQEAIATLLAFEQQQTRDRDARRRSPFIHLALLEGTAAGDPAFPPASYAAGFDLLRGAQYERALEAFRQAAAGDPLLVDRALQSEAARSGAAALRRGEIRTAIVHLAAAVERSPASSETHRVLGRAYGFDQDWARSARQFEAAIDLNPHDERSRLALADVLVDSGQLAEAERVLVDATRAIPDSGRAHFRLGQLYLTLGRDVEAIQVLEGAIARGPVVGVGRLHAAIGRIQLGRNNLDAAIAADERWARANPNDVTAHRTLGDAYRVADRSAEALAEYVAVLMIDPQNADAYAAIGQLQSAAGRYREAAQVLRRAVELNPRLRGAWYALAGALIRLDQADAGRHALETFQLLQREVTDEERRQYEINELKRDAVLHEGAGQFGLAAATWRKVVEGQRGASDSLVNLARALVKAGQTEDAVEVYASALSRGAPISVHRELIDLLAALARTDDRLEAQATYDRLKEERLRRLGASP